MRTTRLNGRYAVPTPATTPLDAFLHDEAELLTEAEIQEVTQYLLSAPDQSVRDHAINALLAHAAGAAGRTLDSGSGSALGGLLKNLGRQCLPPPWSLSPQPGSFRATLGVDPRGLNRESAEFEVARRFVQLASEATRNVLEHPGTADPRILAAAALEAATHAFTPGVLTVRSGQTPWNRMPAAGGWVGAGGAIERPEYPRPTAVTPFPFEGFKSDRFRSAHRSQLMPVLDAPEVLQRRGRISSASA